MQKKLRRSKNNRMIAGVCGGIGEYLNIDTIIIRILWVIFMFMSDTPALIAYVVCIFIIPEEESIIYSEEDDMEDISSTPTGKNSSLYVGIGLILLGSYLLVKRIWPKFALKFIQLKKYWPALLILLGIYIIINRFKNDD